MANHAEQVHAALKRAWLTLASAEPLATRLQCQTTQHASCHLAVYEAWDRAIAAWPTLATAVTVEVVLALWAAKLATATAAATQPATTDCATQLSKLRVADLLLAAACSAGHAQALALFEANYLSAVPRAIARIVPSQSDIAEIQQQLREMLLVRPASTPPTSARICELAGQGDLGGLVRVIAIRTALNARRAQRRHVESDDEIAVAVLTSGDNPEFVAMRNQHHQLLKAILAQALAALPAKERTVLRMHIVEAMSIDDIGAAHGVHRATAARWLERIREALRKDAMRLLRIEVGDQTHLDSLYRLVDTQFDISFKRLVAAP